MQKTITQNFIHAKANGIENKSQNNTDDGRPAMGETLRYVQMNHALR